MKERKFNVSIYVVLRVLVLLTLIRQVYLGRWHEAFLCALTLILFLLPSMISKRMRIEIPKTLEIVILIFIFSAEILGEVRNFYGLYPHWDTILHTINGFLAAAIGFSLFDLLNDRDFDIVRMSPILVSLVAFCFSMTIGVLWEFIEFGADMALGQDMQKDRIVQTFQSVMFEPDGKNIPIKLSGITQTAISHTDVDGNPIVTIVEGGYLDIGIIDTMKDLLVNFIGAVIFSIIGYFYLQNREKFKYVSGLIPRRKYET